MDVLRRIRATRGLLAKIAKECGITPGAVSMWKQIPAERVVDIERITEIPREQLRPDLYRGECG